MLTSVTFILLLCYSAVLCNPHGVFWTILEKHVVIGEDLNLYCNESSLAAINCCPKQSTRRWFGGPNRELLYRNGISSYPSKYTSRLENGGFYLTIHDVEVKDLNVSYACSVSIYEYTNILRPKYDTAETSLSTEISISREPSISGSTTVGWIKVNTNDHNKELTHINIALAISLVLSIVVAIAAYYRREIKKLLMRKCGRRIVVNEGSDLPVYITASDPLVFGADGSDLPVYITASSDLPVYITASISSLSGDDGIGSLCRDDGSDLPVYITASDPLVFGADENLMEFVTTTENTDQNNIVEPENLMEFVTTTENTDQNNIVEPVHSNDASKALQNGTEDINVESEPLIEAVTTTENTDQKEIIEPEDFRFAGR